MPSRHLLTIILAAVILVAFNAAAAAEERVVPSLTFTTLSGRDVSLSDYRGKVLVVNFFATWCLPCRLETPELVRLQNKYAGDGLQIIGLSMDKAHARETVKGFVAEFKIPYPVGMIRPQATLSFGGVRRIPTTYVLDRQGGITDMILGYDGSDRLESAIRRVLSEG